MEKKAEYYADVKNIDAENSRLEYYGSLQVPNESVSYFAHADGVHLRGDLNVTHYSNGDAALARHRNSPSDDGSNVHQPSGGSPPSRPQPNPLQDDRPISLTPALTEHEQPPASSSKGKRPVLQIPAQPPKYKVGVLLAIHAQNHLSVAKMEAIGRELRKARRSIRDDMWIAQVGFMHGRKVFLGQVKEPGLYGPEHQVILITVLDPWRISQWSFNKLLRRLSREMGPFHGLLTWGKQVEQIAPSYEPPNGSTGTVFHKPSSSGILNVGRKGPGRGATISVKVSNHLATKDGPNYMRTQHDFEIGKEGENDALSVSFGKVSFQGPQGYRLNEAKVCIHSDVACDFTALQPNEKGPVESDGQYEETRTETKKKSDTKELMAEGSNRGVKVQAKGGRTTGEENATSHKFTRNALHIDVETATLDSKGATVTYTSANPELDKKKLIVKGEDHPKVQMTPIHESPFLEAVTIRTFAAWRCDEERPKGELGFGRRLVRWGGFGATKEMPEYRLHADAIFCTEVIFERGTTDNYNLTTNITEDF